MISSAPQTDRRTTQRAGSKNVEPITITYMKEGLPTTIKASYLDFGETGLGASVGEEIPMGSEVKVRLTQGGATVQKEGVVRWILPAAGNGSKAELGFKLGIHLGRSEPTKTLAEERRGPADRRRPGPWFNRRNTNRREKEFMIDHNVYLSDTNLVGNTYFAKHFEWQGHVREAFLFHVVKFPEFVKLGIKLITKEASCEYMSESTLGDPIALTLRVGKVTYARLELLFTFIHKVTGKVISKGRQIIVFGGPNGKPVGIPPMIIKGILPFR